MAILGFPLSVPLGHNDDMIKWLELKPLGGGVRADFQPASNYGQNFRICIDGTGFNSLAAPDNRISEIVAPYPYPAKDHLICVAPIGDWTAAIDVSAQYVAAAEKSVDRFHLDIVAAPSFFAYDSNGDITQLSNWNISGLQRWQNCKPLKGHPSWATVEFTLRTIASVHYLILSIGGHELASGQITGDGTITISPLNNSGLSGSVDLAYSADISSGLLVADYPTAYKIYYRKTSMYSGGDFPQSAQATITDDSIRNVFTYSSPQLDAGTYYVCVHQVNANGIESDSLDNATVEIKARPIPVSGLTYSGGGPAASVIQFQPYIVSTMNAAVFAGTDTTTKGTWANPTQVYGTSAYRIPYYSGGTYSAIEIWGLAHTWANPTTDIRALQTSHFSTTRIADSFQSNHTWETLQLSVDLTLLTGTWYKISLYFLDWNNTGLSQTIELHATALSGPILDTQTVSSFNGGKWLSWYCRGKVHFNISQSIAGNALCAAIAVDPATQPLPETFNVYDSGNNEIMDSTPLPGLTYSEAGTNPYTLSTVLPALSSGYTGKRYILVKSVNEDGIEDGANMQICIDYALGTSSKLPPNPSTNNPKVAGKTITVATTIDTTKSPTRPVAVWLYVFAAGGSGSVDFNSPTATATITGNAIKIQKTLTTTVASNGDYQIILKTVDATGQRSEAATVLGPYRLSDAMPNESSFEIRGGL